MKKLFIIFVLFVFLVGALNAQDASVQMYESKYYKVYSEISQQHAQSLAEKLDAYFELYNTYFHFDPDNLSGKLKVKLLSTAESYQKYLTRTVPNVKNSFVFLQYKNKNKSELVGYYEENATFDSAIIHHGFIQFLKSFVINPPLWIQKGFAIYFEKSTYDETTKTVTYRENLSWLETLKDYIARTDFETKLTHLYILDDLLTLDITDAEAKVDVFYAESWGLVSFLLNSEYKSYNRLLWDAVGALSQDATKSKNEAAVNASAFKWVNSNIFQADFLQYVIDVKSFPELIQLGMDEYTEGNFEASEKAFNKALTIDDTHYIPLYYLGLINYAKEDYIQAEYYYRSAIELGGNAGLSYYALGVNSFADNRFEDAIFYLSQSVDIDPNGYGTKSEQLLIRIEEDIEAANAFGGGL